MAKKTQKTRMTSSVANHRVEVGDERLLSLRLRTLLSAVALGWPFALAACRPSERGRDAVAESAATTVAASWYRAGRTLDLTGDGRADSVHLEAVGGRPDSLRITLTAHVGGAEKHRESWGSSYEITLADSVTRTASRLDAFLRAQLDSVLASVVVEPLDAPGVRLMAEDSVVLAGLDPRPSQRISFSYGYETTVRLVWDAPRARFVRLWSCC